MKDVNFKDMNLSDSIYRAVEDMGFEEMTPIQYQAIPSLLKGEDIIGQAQTGTGKTAAFGIPIVETCNGDERVVQAMVLSPTRELCIQVAEEINKLAKYKKDIYVLPIYGGQPIDRQIKALKKGVQIVVGTPGRVIDHIRRKTLKLDNLKILVLDEADEMFDMGFRDDIELIVNHTSDDRQTAFFSATMPKEILNFSKKYQNNPKTVKVVPKELTVPKVEQLYVEVKESNKVEVLSRFIDLYNPKLSLIFCNTKKKVDQLTAELQGRGYFADGLHGDLKQSQRDKVMSKFRSGNIDMLVATDVAARGIDVDDVDMVFNYDVPQDVEYYVHRIGRTARAGREGVAISFVAGRERNRIKDIERYAKTKISRTEIPTLKDMEDKQSDALLKSIREVLDKGHLDSYKEIVKVLEEEDYNSLDISAALLKSYMDSNKIGSHKKLDTVDSEKRFSKNISNKDSARIFISAGKRDGVRARHIVAAMLEETGIPRNDIGEIDLLDKFSFVDIPKKYADDVTNNLNNKRIKGIKVRVELAEKRR